MPAYDYICRDCGAVKEVNHGMLEEVEILCDTCGTKMFKAVSGGVGVIYKGMGWVGKGSGTTTPVRTTEVGVQVQPGMEGVLDEKVRKNMKRKG